MSKNGANPSTCLVMHRSVIPESSSDAEELSHVDNEEEEIHSDSDSHEQKQNEFNQELKQKINSMSYGFAPDDSNSSLYNRCWQRAEHYVQEYIKEQDAAANDKLKEDQTSSGREQMDDQESEEEIIDDCQQIDFKDRSDTELSQLSQSSSDESKTYSEVYSEIFEESKARLKKAEKIRKVYNSNNNRTRRWVENIRQSDIEDCTTDASDRSDKESEENFQQSDKELDYETLVKEQLEVIAQYQNDPLGSFRSCIKEYMCELQELQNDKEKKALNNPKSKDKAEAEENPATNRSNHSNVISIKSYSQNLDFETKSLRMSPIQSCDEDKDPNINTTEILHFEHCEIYHVKQSDKSTIKDLQLKTNQSNDNRIFPTEEIVTSRSNIVETKPLNKEKCEISDDSDHYEESSSRNVENQQFEEAINSADQLEVQNCDDHIESAEESSNEEMTRQNSESESDKTSSKYIEMQKFLRTRHRLNKSERASNNSHKSLYLPTSSSHSQRIRNSHGESSDSTDNYYLSSKSLTSSSSQISSKRSRKARSVTKTPRTFEDRGCSPIKIKSSRRKNQMNEACDDDKEDIPESPNSSADKGLQYPSENELEESVKSEKSLKIYDLDNALLGMPTDFKGNSIIFDNEDEFLDISLSDDEMQMQAKLQAAALSDRKKDGSSGNSSFNSIPSADRSSICSISSYEPSVRFYRRTQIEDDDADNPVEESQDSQPMTYKKHVARLAERALRTCTNYYNEGIKLNPALDQELNAKVQMIYNSEMRFNTLEKTNKEDDLLQEFNERLQRQLKCVAPRFQ